MSKRLITIFLAICFIAAMSACAGESEVIDGGTSDASADSGPADSGNPQHVYTDSPFPQWLREEYTTAKGTIPWNDVRALAVDNEGVVWAGGSGGLLYYTPSHEKGSWHQDSLTGGPDGLVVSLAVKGGVLYAATPGKIFARSAGSGWTVAIEADGIISVSATDTGLLVSEKRGLGVYEGGSYSIAYQDENLKARSAAFSQGRVYAATSQGAAEFIKDGSTISHVRYYTNADGMPSGDVRAAAIDSAGKPWFGTAAGLAFLESGKIVTVAGELGQPPYDDITHLHFMDAETLLVSTSIGVDEYYTNLRQFRYFHDRYWMPDNEVRAAVSADGWTMFFATAGGIAKVYPRYATLADKASHYDQMNRARHGRMGYYTRCVLKTPGDVSDYYNVDDDNDGQWTGMYLGALSLQYAVTRDTAVRGWAQESMRAMLKLESVTEVPGFFARSIVAGTDCPAKQKGEGEWHLTSDGLLCWKGNTSSDEFVGHVFGLALYYDLVADEAEKKEIAADISRILTRIIDYGYVIADVDGQATEDGHFDPMFMETVGLVGDAGLNSAMILGGLLFGYRATGDKKFMDSFNYLAKTKGYKNYVRDLQEIGERWHINHDSHEMSFLALYTLVRYETDPQLKNLWLEGISKLWETQRPERDPEFNYIYAAVTGAPVYDWEKSVDTLLRIPWELVVWGSKNSHRKDITVDPKPDRQGHAQSTVVLPYDERNVMKWNDNPYRLDNGGDGRTEESATYWLLPYWMGRYYGLITPPRIGPDR